MDDAPPPTVHVLRPHHVVVLTALVLIFKDPAWRRLPSEFLLHLYRVVLNEVSEVSRPRSYKEFMKCISEGPKVDEDDARRFVAALMGIHVDLKNAEQLTNFFSNLPSLFVEKHEDMRRSIFGYFCRRCFVSFLKLSFSGVVKLQQDYQAWCFGSLDAGYETIQKDQLSNYQLIFKTQADKKSWAKADAYEVFENGFATGDEKIATENLRRFFEQHFHENNDSGVRQHALLNLVRMHYLNNETATAQKLLSEAVTVARTSGDRITLQHCISMLHRLPPPKPGKRPTLNEIQPDLHPFEILFDVKKLMDTRNEQPLSAAFSKIYEAMGLYDHWLDVQLALPVEEEQWAQHAVQSLVWNAAGCDKLAAIEEIIVLTFTREGSEDNNRITVLLNKAYKLARQGEYETSLSMLLNPSVWRGLSVNDYTSWAHQIWHVLALRATRRGQGRLFREYLLPRRPSGDYNPRDYLNNAPSVAKDNIRDPLYEVIQMRRCEQPTSAMEQLLKALWNSEFLMRFSDYRTGIIALADVSIEFGMLERSQRILDEIMPQIIDGNDLEQRAFACFTLARCILATASTECPNLALDEAISYLLISEADYKKLEMYQALLDTQYLMSVVYHNRGLVKERDEAARRHSETQAKQKLLGTTVVEGELNEIFQTVSQVGAALAGRPLV